MGYKGLISSAGDLDNGAGDLLFSNFNQGNPYSTAALDLYGGEDESGAIFSGALSQYIGLGD
jgi:hypothetical protein